MTKAEAKRWICGTVAAHLDAGMGDVIEETGQDFSEADQERLFAAMYDLIAELRRRGRD